MKIIDTMKSWFVRKDEQPRRERMTQAMLRRAMREPDKRRRIKKVREANRIARRNRVRNAQRQRPHTRKRG